MGVVDKAADYLKDAGMAVDIFTDVEANPSVTTVEKRQKRIRIPAQILSLRWAVVLLWMWQKQWELRLNMAAVLQNMRGHIRFPENCSADRNPDYCGNWLRGYGIFCYH